jgi:type I restriction enzyme S subunit
LRPGWTARSIDDLGIVGRGRSRHRPRNDESLYGGEFAFIQTAEIHEADLFITDYRQTYNNKGLDQSRLWEPGTVCITNAGENTGDCAVLGIAACIPDSIIAVQVDREKSDPVFLKYAVDLMKPQFRQVTRGATQDNLSVEKLLSFKFPVPAPAVQRRIAEILRQYGEMIQNNHRRIALLEEAARLLYHEWFVLLRFPGHEHTRIINGVPAGWERKSLGEVATLTYGKSLREEERKDGAIRVYGSSGVVGTHDQKLVSGPGIVVGRKGNVGSVYWEDGDFWPIDTVYYVDAVESSLFLLHNLMNQPFQSSDAAVPGLNRSYASGLPVLLPKKALRDEFEAYAGAFREEIRVLAQMNVKLRAARDLLLPRLMSGEITV